MRLLRFVLLPVSFFSLWMVAGCGSAANPLLPPARAGSLRGTAHGGQQPLKQALITVWAAGGSGYGSAATALARTYTDDTGSFGFAPGTYTCPSSDAPVYLTAEGGDPGVGSNNAALMLAASIGPCSGAPYASVSLNEVTTTATAFALNQFFTNTLGTGSTDAFGSPADQSTVLALANASTVSTLVNVAAGSANASSSAVTLESAKLNTIANVLAACVNSPGTGSPCDELFAATTTPGGVKPTDTLQAAVQMARAPYRSVKDLFNLASPIPPFVGLGTAPSDWTLAIGYNSSSFGLSVEATENSGSSTNLDIDSSGKVWFPSTKAGAAGVGTFDPATGTFGGPYLTELVQPQYLTIDQNGILWATDMESTQMGRLDTANPASNSVVGVGGTTQAIATASDNTLYFAYASGGTFLGSMNVARTQWSGVGPFDYPATAIMPFSSGSSSTVDILDSGSGASSPCEIGASIKVLGSALSGYFVQTGSPCESGGGAIAGNGLDVLSVASTKNELCSVALQSCFSAAVPLSLPEGMATDGAGNLWVANAGSSSVSTLNGWGASDATSHYTETSPVAYLHGSGNGGTMSQPYGLAIDGAGDVWTSNVSCTTNTPGCTPATFTLTELVGAAAPTIAPLSLQQGGMLTGMTPAAKRGREAAVVPLQIGTQGLVQTGVSLPKDTLLRR